MSKHEKFQAAETAVSTPLSHEPSFAKQKHEICIVQIIPEGYVHAHAFDEVAQGLAYAFEDIGFHATHAVNAFSQTGINVLLGAHLLDENYIDLLPEQTVIYNLEQLHDDSWVNTPAYEQALRKFKVWDYSPANLAFLKARGMGQNPQLLPIGYNERLTRIEKPQVQDIDVLFYGSINPRRQKILDELKDAGLKTEVLTGVYGAQRDAFIARSKLVLNLHFYDTQIFELARVSYLLANKKAVVTEKGSKTQFPAELDGQICAVPYASLVDTCKELVADTDRRNALETAGFEAFRKMPQDLFITTHVMKPVAGAQNVQHAPVNDAPTTSTEAETPAAPVAKPAAVATTTDAPAPQEDTAKPLLGVSAATSSAAPRTLVKNPDNLPLTLNIGSGKDFRQDCVNLDYADYWDPDIQGDLSSRTLLGTTKPTDRFGDVTLQDDMFTEILCNDVVEHIPDLVSAMTNCLDMLKVGGVMRIGVPYDLSYGAWQDPTHVRAFNERSWLYYTDWFWYIGWDKARFHLRELNYKTSDLGDKLLKDGMPQEEIIRTPRAVDSMHVVLEKQLLSDRDKAVLASARKR